MAPGDGAIAALGDRRFRPGLGVRLDLFFDSVNVEYDVRIFRGSRAAAFVAVGEELLGVLGS